MPSRSRRSSTLRNKPTLQRLLPLEKSDLAKYFSNELEAADFYARLRYRPLNEIGLLPRTVLVQIAVRGSQEETRDAHEDMVDQARRTRCGTNGWPLLALIAHPKCERDVTVLMGGAKTAISPPINLGIRWLFGAYY